MRANLMTGSIDLFNACDGFGIIDAVVVVAVEEEGSFSTGISEELGDL